MRIVILTQYYPPETGAPQNRLSSLAKYLLCFGNEVEVVTAMPNYPKYEIFPGYKGKKYVKETMDGIRVHRSSLFVSKTGGMMNRLANYFSFTLTSYYTGVKRVTPPDILICESPPLFLGITAVFLKRRWKCRLVFNVSDLWPESAEKMGIITNKAILNLSYRLARWIYRNADLVSGQTQGIIQAIRNMQPEKQLFWFPNGADMDIFNVADERVEKKRGFAVLYAGIIGHAQGLEVVLQAAHALREHQDIHFYLIGDGPEKSKLVGLKDQLGLHNITFIPHQAKETVMGWVKSCDACVVPLRKLDLFRGAIPSKLFEPLATGKPILLGVEGEAKELFIDQANAGVFYEPENGEALKEAVLKLYHDPALAHQLGCNGRRYVDAYFRRDKIAEAFWQELQRTDIS